MTLVRNSQLHQVIHSIMWFITEECVNWNCSNLEVHQSQLNTRDFQQSSVTIESALQLMITFYLRHDEKSLYLVFCQTVNLYFVQRCLTECVRTMSSQNRPCQNSPTFKVPKQPSIKTSLCQNSPTVKSQYSLHGKNGLWQKTVLHLFY